MKINGYIFPIALGVAVITGAIAYGEQKATVNDHDRRIETLEQTPLKVQAIEKSQVGMQRDIEAMRREQQTSQAHVQRQLDRILRKLDEE